MKVIFTEHSKFRMWSRNISKLEVIDAILNPEITSKQQDKLLSKKIRKNGQLLIVCHMYRGDSILVITVITTSKLRKYLI